jgi:hypothetical protein
MQQNSLFKVYQKQENYLESQKKKILSLLSSLPSHNLDDLLVHYKLAQEIFQKKDLLMDKKQAPTFKGLKTKLGEVMFNKLTEELENASKIQDDVNLTDRDYHVFRIQEGSQIFLHVGIPRLRYQYLENDLFEAMGEEFNSNYSNTNKNVATFEVGKEVCFDAIPNRLRVLLLNSKIQKSNIHLYSLFDYSQLNDNAVFSLPNWKSNLRLDNSHMPEKFKGEKYVREYVRQLIELNQVPLNSLYHSGGTLSRPMIENLFSQHTGLSQRLEGIGKSLMYLGASRDQFLSVAKVKIDMNDKLTKKYMGNFLGIK